MFVGHSKTPSVSSSNPTSKTKYVGPINVMLNMKPDSITNLFIDPINIHDVNQNVVASECEPRVTNTIRSIVTSKNLSYESRKP